MNRIEKEAEDIYPIPETGDPSYLIAARNAFIAGALSEQARAQKLVEALKELMLFVEKDGWVVNGYRTLEIMLQIKQALSDWEGEKEGYER